MENTESLEEKKTKYSEEDLIKLLKKIGKENSEIFFDKAIELVERLNIDKPDDRLTFGTSQNARLAITIGQRYCLAFIPNRLKPWSFIVSKEVPSNSSIVSSIFNGKPIAYYCESLEAKELINRFEDVVDASKVELKTTDKSGFRKFNNPYFEKTIFDAMYRNELFDKAFNVEETEISEIYRNLTFNSSNDVCLKDIYVVLYLMKKRGKTANDAYKLISSATKKRFQTISDACTRRLANKGQSYFESSVKSKEVLQDIKTKFKLNEDDNKKFNDLFIDGTKKLIKNTNMNVKIKGQDDLDIKSKTSTALNQILYGPPGTGKTFNSIDKAVEIASPERFISGDHLHNKLVFDELRKQGQIEFVTFHQNYSYEDFMVGIRPDVDNDVLRFKRMKGIFYEISNKAKDNYFDSIKDPEIVSYESWVKITFEKFKDHIMDTIEKDGKYQIMNSVSIYSVEDDAFIYTGEKKDGQLWKNERLGMHYEPLLFMFNNNVLNRKDIQNLDVKIPSLEKQHSTYCLEVINRLNAAFLNLVF